MNRPLPSVCLSVALSCGLAVGAAAPALAQTAPVRSEAPGVVDVVKDTLGDFRRLPSTEAVTWLSIGAAAASMGRGADWPMSNALSGSRALDTMFAPGETIGGARFQLAGALVTYAAGRFTGQGRVANLGADLVRANVVAQALTAGIKLSVRRGRPDGTEFSFPSGHTSVSFAAATVFQKHFGWKGGVPAYAAASYIAASRIQERRHFLSDVAFGAVVGIVAGRTVTIGRGDYRFAVEPMAAASGGVGIAFTRR
jgi:membrane-associated phospholipid phosphatase